MYFLTGSFPIRISRSVGSLLGSELLFVYGPIFKTTDKIECTFGTITIPCKYISEDVCVTVTPAAHEVGIVHLTVTITRNGRILTGLISFRYGLLTTALSELY